MKTAFVLLVLAVAMVGWVHAAADGPFYELRTYYAHPGKLDDLHKRFRDHTAALFEKHGMTNIGYWVPVENKQEALIYLLSYPSRAARDKSWKAFSADTDWKKAYEASHVNGPLVKKVESVFLQATDFSPAVAISKQSPERTFELRVYKTPPGKLDALLKRFQEHTVKLFAKHGMTNIGYWVPTDEKQGASDTLIYLLAHKDAAAHAKSFKEFRADPDWVAAKSASEADGSLTIKVESTLMKPTDYSPSK